MKRWEYLLPALVVAFLPGMNFAEEPKKNPRSPVTMDEVVVTGVRTEGRVERIPANITVIDELDIKNSNAKSVPELLRTEEGIVVRDILGTGKTATVDLRGFGETASYNTLVLVDGRRVNEIDLSGVDWTQLPLEQIERIEVLRGTGSVLYGDNAVGGVINIITKVPAPGMNFSAGILAGSYSRNKEQFSINGGTERIAASFSGSYDATQGYRENNEFRAGDVGGKVAFKVADLFKLDLSGSHHTDNYGLPGYLTKEQLASNRRASLFPSDEAETRDDYVSMRSDVDLKEFGSIAADLSYRNRKSEYTYALFTSFSRSATDTWGFTPRYIWNSEVMHHKNMFVAGIDLYGSDQDTKSFFGFPLSPSGLSNVEKDSSGFYFSDEFFLLPNLIIALGARYESADYRLNQTDPLTGASLLDSTIKESETAYTTGLTFLYADKSSLFLRSNRSFRFPLTDELIEFDQATFSQVINTDLKPQTGQHYEAGIRHYFTPVIQGSVTIFRAQLKDEIFLDPRPKPFFGTNENHPKTLHQGLEIGAKLELFDLLTLFGNYTYEKASFDAQPFEGNDIPGVPRNKFNLGFRVHDLYPGFVFSTDLNYVGSSYLLSDQVNQSEKLESYYTVDSRISYAWRYFNAFLGVNNLLNRQYSSYGIASASLGPVFYPSPERNWVCGLQLAF